MHRNHTKHIARIAYCLMILIVSSCQHASRQQAFKINGTWILKEIIGVDGTKRENPYTDFDIMRIYDDSCYYQCEVTKAPNGTMISPSKFEGYTLIDKGHNNYTYLQGEGPHPLRLISDSIMSIQEIGRKYIWTRCDSIDKERIEAIISIIKNDANANGEYFQRYVFSNAEQQLHSSNNTLIIILAVILISLIAIANYSYNLYKKKKRVEQELKLIEQERNAMPKPVRMAMNSVEDEFRNSDLFLSLRKKITSGKRLSTEDWNGIEERFRSVYPRFTSTLITLHNMSETELRVCYLIKLNASPSEIAGVISKDTSSVSSIRSRLYKKVFGKKGSSKDWDEFIRSL